MLDITIISVGKIKESYWREALDEYVKRLKPYSKLEFWEVPEEPVTSASDRKRILDKEAKKILKIIPDKSIVIAMDIAGEVFSSPVWSTKLEEWSKFGNSITFIIGGPLGLSTRILNKARVLLSLSKMTFTHQLARVILLEQIYRGAMILGGKTYHY